jgi:hypothetical protein
MTFEQVEPSVVTTESQTVSPLRCEAQQLLSAAGSKGGGGGKGGQTNPPDHGFKPGKPGWGPPANSQWGWQNPDLWRSGYDSSFFNQDPNHDLWKDVMRTEAANIVGKLDSGKTAEAAQELKEDLYAMRGDLYGQDELLSQINSLDKKGSAADINLRAWSPERGTWDNMEVVQQEKMPFAIHTFGAAADSFPSVDKSASRLLKDLDRVDIAQFQDDARKAYDDGTLAESMQRLGAETMFNHFDPEQTKTEVALDNYQAYINNQGGDVLMHLNVETVTDSKGRKVTTVIASGSKSHCHCPRYPYPYQYDY